MMAADSSTWIAFLNGTSGTDVDLLDEGLADRHVLMVPPVLTELLSDPGISADVSKSLLELPLVNLEAGFWQRAGKLRASVLARGRRARLGDVLIAQSCLDAGIRLVTRDHDFLAFAETAGLNVMIGSSRVT